MSHTHESVLIYLKKHIKYFNYQIQPFTIFNNGTIHIDLSYKIKWCTQSRKFTEKIYYQDLPADLIEYLQVHVTHHDTYYLCRHRIDNQSVLVECMNIFNIKELFPLLWQPKHVGVYSPKFLLLIE